MGTVMGIATVGRGVVRARLCLTHGYYRPITIESDVPHFNPASSFASNCNLHRRHGSRLKGKMDRQEVAPQHRLARDKCGRTNFFFRDCGTKTFFISHIQ